MENTRTNKGSQLEIPKSGIFLINDWARIVGCTPKILRKKLRERHFRIMRLDALVFIRADWFFEDVLAQTNDPQTLGEGEEDDA